MIRSEIRKCGHEMWPWPLENDLRKCISQSNSYKITFTKVWIIFTATWKRQAFKMITFWKVVFSDGATSKRCIVKKVILFEGAISKRYFLKSDLFDCATSKMYFRSDLFRRRDLEKVHFSEVVFFEGATSKSVLFKKLFFSRVRSRKVHFSKVPHT